jgi:hypothetical protein
MVFCGLPACLEYGHHAPSIRLGDLDSSIALSLEIHRHLRASVIDSIMGDSRGHSNRFVHDPMLCYVPHRQVAQPTERLMVDPQE